MSRRRRIQFTPPFDKVRVGYGGGNIPTAVAEFNPLLPDFYAPFADAGAGVCNLTLTSGSGSATFTRTTAKTTVLSTGLIGNIASGSPASRYDPATQAYQGFFREQIFTNICLQSEDFATTWTTIGSPTITPASATCGTVSLSTLDDTSALELQGVTQTIAGLSGDAVKAFAIFFKEGTSASSVFRIRDTTAGADRLLGAITWSGGVPTVTMTTGTLVQTSGLYGASGVYRAEVLTTSVTAANTNVLELYPATDAALTVLSTGTVIMGGAQLQNNTDCPRSYVKTTTASVTVNTDALGYPSANVNILIGTAYAEVSVPVSSTANSRLMMAIGGSGTAGLLLGIPAGSAVTTIRMDDGPNPIEKTGLTSALNTPRKRASHWGGIVQSITGDGATVATGTFDGAMASGSLSFDNSSVLSFCIKEAKVWQTQATDAQIVTLTA